MTQRPSSQRIQPRGPESRNDQFMILVTAAVVAVAVVIVLAGVYLTRIRPPRAHVVTVGSQQFNAAAIEERTRWLLQQQQELIPKDVLELVPKTLDRFEREGVIRQRAASLVGELSADDLDKEMRSFFAPPQPTATLPNGSPVAVATPTPLPDDAYTRLLAERLQKTGVSKQFLENLVRAQALETRLRDHFKKDLPKTTAQVHLAVARVADRAKADQLREIVLRPGVEFEPVANTGSVPGAGPSGDIGWVLPEELNDAVRGAIKDMKPGDISAVTQNQQLFEVYKVIESDPAREVTAAQQTTLANKKLDAWLEGQRNEVHVSRDLSSSEDEWIRKRAIAAYQKVNRAPRAP